MAKYSNLKRTVVIVPKVDLTKYDLISMLTTVETSNNSNSDQHPRYISVLRAPYLPNGRHWWPTAPVDHQSTGATATTPNSPPVKIYEQKYLTVSAALSDPLPIKSHPNTEQPNVHGILSTHNFRVLSSIVRTLNQELSDKLLGACMGTVKNTAIRADLYCRKSHGVIINDVEVAHKDLLIKICTHLATYEDCSRILPESDVMFHFYNPVYAYQHPEVDITGTRYIHERFKQDCDTPTYIPNPVHDQLLSQYSANSINPQLELRCKNMKGSRNIHIPRDKSRNTYTCRIRNTALSMFLDEMFLVNDTTREESTKFRSYLTDLIPFSHKPESIEIFSTRTLLEGVLADAHDATDRIINRSGGYNPLMPSTNLTPYAWNSDVISILRPGLGKAGITETLGTFIESRREKFRPEKYDQTITVLQQMLSHIHIRHQQHSLV